MRKINTVCLTCRDFWDSILKNDDLQMKVLSTLGTLISDKAVTGNGDLGFWADKSKVIYSYFNDIGFDVVGLSYRPYGIKVQCKDGQLLMYSKNSGSHVCLAARPVR